MSKILRGSAFALVACVLSACGGGGGNVDGECIYFGDQHTQYSPDQCRVQASELDCDSWELEDRSSVDQTIVACLYEGCTDTFDCDAFRDF
jgi:hypothetical protein